MACASLYFCVLVLFSTGFGFVFAQNFCGSKEPDSDKLCVSLRLPWQSSPIYFCTDKGKINYRNKCKSPGTYCPAIDGNTLQISTPWDCCPITSQPDPCANAKCPPAPLNRTCTEYFTDSYWDCCPHYYCEEGNREMCHIKRLEPGCTSNTREKENCTAFIDPHGCCNKYQCERDTKPGICPTMKHQTYVGTPIRVMGSNFTVMNASESLNEDSQSAVNSSNRLPFPPTRYSIVSFGSLLQCVGDYTCPKQMKCCSVTNSFEDPRFNRPHLPKVHFHRQANHAIHGYCMEPALEKN